MLKRIELWGRKLLVILVGVLLGVRQRKVELPQAPRILVVRLDERVGNLLLLTPLLATLRARFPSAEIDVLGNARGALLLERHPAVSSFSPFRKRAIFATDGPLRTPLTLRRRRYDLAIEASNPTDPSATQALLVRFSGAHHTIGSRHGPFAPLFSAPVTIEDARAHEIDLRLQLLAPLGPGAVVRATSLGALAEPAADSPVAALARDGALYAVLNVGARLTSKQLAAADYAALADLVAAAGLRCVITYGPAERPLADDVARLAPRAVLAPPTALHELAALMRAAQAVVSCDTGPMHLAVAAGTPTCGIFVSTEPARYGYADAPHLRLDLRDDTLAAKLPAVWRWLTDAAEQRRGRAS